MHDIRITDMRELPGDSAFLIDDGKTAIMYDSGFAFTGDAVADKIAAELGDSRTLDYIFLTHSHYDHALGSVYAKRRYPQAKVAAGEYAASIFAKPSARALMRELDGKFAARCGVTEYEDLIDSLAVDIPLRDGDTVAAGDMLFEAVTLAGHTKCSGGYYLAENKLLLGTETLGVYVGGGVTVPSCLVGVQMTYDAIERVRGMDIRNILVPHYGLLDEEETRVYLRGGAEHLNETVRQITDILRAGGSEDDAIDFFRDKYYHGYTVKIYPPDAMELNTRIMVRLFKKELMDE